MGRKDIIITKADKEGAVVIMDVNKYVNECNKQLDNTEYYTKLSSDPTELHRSKINCTIRNFESRNLIESTVSNNLVSNK